MNVLKGAHPFTNIGAHFLRFSHLSIVVAVC
ncbi:hypothetical protein IL54_2561 [Sphingobium sp. ba1]|nr:hypothetical protein IL54_2561 [Sphingobium sp. ba1]